VLHLRSIVVRKHIVYLFDSTPVRYCLAIPIPLLNVLLQRAGELGSEKYNSEYGDTDFSCSRSALRTSAHIPKGARFDIVAPVVVSF
jgi:hypothetical protein